VGCASIAVFLSMVSLPLWVTRLCGSRVTLLSCQPGTSPALGCCHSSNLVRMCNPPPLQSGDCDPEPGRGLVRLSRYPPPRSPRNAPGAGCLGIPPALFTRDNLALFTSRVSNRYARALTLSSEGAAQRRNFKSTTKSWIARTLPSRAKKRLVCLPEKRSSQDRTSRPHRFLNGGAFPSLVFGRK
jgi:hypothetical protein